LNDDQQTGIKYTVLNDPASNSGRGTSTQNGRFEVVWWSNGSWQVWQNYNFPCKGFLPRSVPQHPWILKRTKSSSLYQFSSRVLRITSACSLSCRRIVSYRPYSPDTERSLFDQWYFAYAKGSDKTFGAVHTGCNAVYLVPETVEFTGAEGGARKYGYRSFVTGLFRQLAKTGFSIPCCLARDLPYSLKALPIAASPVFYRMCRSCRCPWVSRNRFFC
jgi:hypothetical protein